MTETVIVTRTVTGIVTGDVLHSSDHTETVLIHTAVITNNDSVVAVTAGSETDIDTDGDIC